MKVAEFFSHNDFCPICKKYLTREVEIDVMVDKSKPDDFILAGAVFYNFNGTRFIKNTDKLSHTKKHREMMTSICEKFPKTFTLNTRFMLRMSKPKLSDIINPWFVNTFDARFIRMCNSSDHLYYYTSIYIIEGDDADKIEIDYEMIDVHKFRIYNMFENNMPDRTEIADTAINCKQHLIIDPPHAGATNSNHTTLPSIPLTKWDTASYDSIKSQLDKYIVLK